MPEMNPANASFWPVLVPDATFADDLDLDVLIVPGGIGMRNPNITRKGGAADFIARTVPKVQYLWTICTGAGIAAQAGVLDGKHATTNKAAWGDITPLGPKVLWVSPARWVVDGNVWTSSGVSCLTASHLCPCVLCLPCTPFYQACLWFACKRLTRIWLVRSPPRLT